MTYQKTAVNDHCGRKREYMYNCPNCSGNLSFDIASQKLMCDYCKTQLDPYEYQKTQDAEESDDFGVTVFTCPQCGGEIMTTNVTAAGFCTYCGASTILDSRMSKEKRPTHIIPFKRTKEDCRKAYSSLVRRALFTPSEFRDPEYLDRFRGIYIPYWVYDYKLDGNLRMNGKKSYRRGDYMITDYFKMTGEVNATYEGLNHDASSSFDDTVAASIAPFESKGFQPFTPSILCGFYADAPDVDSSVYEEDVMSTICEDALDRLSGVKEYRKDGADLPDTEVFRKNLNSYGLRASGAAPVCAYLPVWFLTYRKKDRVAYAVMNGSTGKITADLPVDEKKYVLGSLLLAIPIFAVLAFLFTMTGHAVLTASSILALISLIIYILETMSISDKDTHANDKGFTFSDRRSKKKAEKDGENGKGSASGKIKTVLLAVFAVFLLLAVGLKPALEYITDSGYLTGYKIYGIVSAVLLLAGIILMGWLAESDTAKKNMYLHTAGSILAVTTASIVFVWNPPSDLWYYGGAILAAAGICLTFLGIIRKYNILATRPLPTFYDRKGGNDRAK